MKLKANNNLETRNKKETKINLETRNKKEANINLETKNKKETNINLETSNEKELSNKQETSNKKEIVLKQKIVGLFKKSNNFGFVIPDDRKIGMDIFISKSKCGKAKNNQKVVAEVIKCPERGRKAEGKIIEILGKVDEAGVDMLSIIKQFNLPNEFPKKY